MSRVRVYRVAYAGKQKANYGFPIGPYQGPWDQGSVDLIDTWSNNRHPTPNRDGLGYMGGGEYCGFTSLRALRTWFLRNGRRALHRAGYRLHIYSVPRYALRRGGRQCVFLYGEAKLIATHSLI